jgi:hypothetical protein
MTTPAIRTPSAIPISKTESAANVRLGRLNVWRPEIRYSKTDSTAGMTEENQGMLDVLTHSASLRTIM